MLFLSFNLCVFVGFGITLKCSYPVTFNQYHHKKHPVWSLYVLSTVTYWLIGKLPYGFDTQLWLNRELHMDPIYNA